MISSAALSPPLLLKDKEKRERAQEQRPQNRLCGPGMPIHTASGFQNLRHCWGGDQQSLHPSPSPESSFCWSLSGFLTFEVYVNIHVHTCKPPYTVWRWEDRSVESILLLGVRLGASGLHSNKSSTYWATSLAQVSYLIVLLQLRSGFSPGLKSSVPFSELRLFTIIIPMVSHLMLEFQRKLYLIQLMGYVREEKNVKPKTCFFL